ncbi:hypothetical protein GCM10011393_13460 [Sphingopyxis bauzanensis]|nr:hypothetical protein GCM10011393_13460 [Sphingopyxis bauzanensis]
MQRNTVRFGFDDDTFRLSKRRHHCLLNHAQSGGTNGRSPQPANLYFRAVAPDTTELDQGLTKEAR